MAKGRNPDRERAPDDWRQTFLDTLSRTLNVSGAARAAKVDASLVYRTRRADPEFSKAWFDALCDGYDALELDLLRRLRLGETQDSTAKRKRKYDNATAFRLLIAHRDSVGKAKASQNHLDEDDIIASINAKLDLMRERMKQAEQAEQDEMLALPAPDAPDDAT